MEKWPIGVFASIDAGLGVKLEVAHELGIPTVHLHAPHQQTRTKENAKRFLDRLGNLGITITAVFGGFEGESYADIPTVVRTVGLVPKATRAARLQEMKEISDFTTLLGCKVVALHIGFVPHDPSDPDYKGIVKVAQELCDHVQRNGQNLHLETGQETAEALLRFIGDVDRDNLFINFDPANMILYGTGDPIEALRKVGKYVRSCHCKDGKWAANPGKEWGVEVPFGQGDVGAETFLRTLKAVGFDGALTIEREIPQEPERQKAEIGQAVRLLKELRAKVLQNADCGRHHRPGADGALVAHERSTCPMPKLSLTVPHNLGEAEAARRVREHYDAMKNHHQDKIQGIEEQWVGNTLHCRLHALGVKVAGTVRTEPSSVSVDAELPMMAAMFKGLIERQIRAELGKLLA